VNRLSALILTLLAFRAALGINLAVHTPAWEAYDEPFHFAYAAQLAQQGTLPDSSNPMHIHPPAYHALVAAFMWLSGSARTQLAPPERNWYLSEGNGNLNFALPARTPAQRETERDLSAARLFTALSALIAAAAAWRAARAVRLAPAFALMATAFFAFHPQALFSSSTVNNDAAALLIGALIVWCACAAVQQRRAHLALTALVLSLIGAAFKLSVLPLSLAACLALAFCVLWKKLIAYVLISSGIIAIGAFSLRDTGILLPFMTQVHTQSAPVALVQRLTSPLGSILLGDALSYGARSAFGVFGWGMLHLPAWLNIALWIGVACSLRGTWRVWRLPLLWLLLCACASMITAAVALSLLYYNGQLLNSRYLLPSLAAWALLLALSWQALSRLGRYIGASMVLVLLATSTWLSLGGLAAFYAPPIVFVAPSTAEGIQLTPTIRLRAYEVLSPSVRGGESLNVALTWQADGAPTENYTLRLAFIGADGNIYGWLHTFHGNGRYPTALWRAGTAFREVYRLPIRRDVPAPSVGYLQVMLVEPSKIVLLDAAPIRVR